MKKISRSIAMILIIVIAAGSLTGCLSWYVMTGEWPSGSSSGYEVIFYPLADVFMFTVGLPITLTVFGIRKGMESAREKRGDKYDGVDTFSAHISSLPEKELDSLMLAFDSLPEEELASLTQRFDSLPEEEFDSFTRTVNSFSDREFTAIVAAFNNLSEAEVAASIETLNSMPEENFIAALDNLQHIEFRYRY